MVSFNSVALLSLAAVGSLAAPAKRNWGGSQCLTQDAANIMAAKYGELIASYTNETAEAVLTPGFTDYSESVNSLINSCPQGDAAKAMSVPLLAASFTSREQFMVGQGQQPPINFDQLKLWYSCDSVTIRWETNNTANITDVKPVVGLIVLETVPAPQSEFGFQIATVYSEFDAAAWLQNLHAAGFCSTEGVLTGSVGGAAPAPAPGSGAPGSGAPGSGAPGSGAPGSGAPGSGPAPTTSTGSWSAPSSAPAWSASSSAPAWSSTSSAAAWSPTSTPCSTSTHAWTHPVPTGGWSKPQGNSTVHRARLMI